MNGFSRLFGGPRKGTAKSRRGLARLGIERLEDRTVPASVSVVPLTQAANNTTTFYALQDAITAAGNNGVVTVEPGAVADFNDDVTQNGLTIQGDPNVASSILPSYQISIDANNVTLKNLNLNFISEDPGFSGLTVARSTVGSIFISGGASGNGNNLITQNTITSDVTIIGNTNQGAATNDQITFNTFESFTSAIVSVSSDNGAVIQGNTIDGGGSISTNTNGNTITKAPQTGIEVDGGVGVKVLNNAIDLAGQNGTPSGTTGTFIGINIAPFNPADAGLPANTPTSAPTVQVLDNTIATGRGTGLAITAEATPTGDRDTQVQVQGNDFHGNLIGVSYTGNGGSSITTDVGGGSLGSLGGNDFRGFSGKGNAAAAAIVLTNVASNAVLVANNNLFLSTVTPSNVVFASAGSITVSQELNANQAFVQALYIDFLGRVGTLTELNNWVSVLTASSNGRNNVIQGISQSTAALDLIVDGYYLQYLGRQADTAGQNYWVSQIQSGMSLEQVQAGFVSSQEFISSNDSDYIQGLYRMFFNRTGSSSELAYWYAQLPTLGLEGVAMAFANSQENREDTVTTVFEKYLHQTASSSDLSFWSGQSGTLASITEQILASSEFFTNG
jgi:Domain of unknown function (DUF4214)